MKKLSIGILCLLLLSNFSYGQKRSKKSFDRFEGACWGCRVDLYNNEKIPGWLPCAYSREKDTITITYEKTGSGMVRDTFKWDNCSCSVFSHLKDNGQKENLPCQKLKQGTWWHIQSSITRSITRVKGVVIKTEPEKRTESGGWGQPSESYQYDGKEIHPIELFKHPVEI